jgi:membrane protease YdiL (CAAX protease family)
VDLLLPLPLIVIANAAVGKSWAHLAIGILTGLVAGATFLFGALELAGASTLNPGLSRPSLLGIEIGTMATGVVAAVLVADPVRKRLARFVPIEPDNPVHALAVSLAVIFFGLTVTTLVFTDVLTGILAQAPLTVSDLFFQEIPFVIIGFAGVGVFIRRNIPAAASRLGLVLPAWWHLALALAVAGLFYAFQLGAGAVSQAFTPAQTQRVDVVGQHVFGGLLANPLSILALGVVPGICEDILFRGALQPRLGLVPTAVLFAAIHTEYAISISLVAILILALGLGLVRKYTNTTTSALCHATYNLLVAVGIVGAVAGAAIGAELVVGGLAAYGIWTQRRVQGAS